MFLCLLMLSCVSTGNSDLASEETMAKIQVGETTTQQIMDLLGKPDTQIKREMAGSTREWWSYTYASAVINPIDYLLLYGLWFNGIGTYDTEYHVAVSFDHRGVVSSLSRVKTDYDMGRPFESLDVTSVSHKTVNSPQPGSKLIHFEDRMEFRY